MNRSYAHLVVAPNPLMLLARSELRTIDGPCALFHLAPKTHLPFIILKNGLPVMRRDWTEPVMEGDLITVRMLPQDGGGGGSNPLKVVLSIAITAFAPQLGINSWLADNVLYMNGIGATGAASLSIANTIVSACGEAKLNLLDYKP